MAYVEGYVPSYDRPPYAADGLVVARRPIPVQSGRIARAGEVVTVEELGGERSLLIHYRNFLVDTLPAGTPVAGAAPDARGRGPQAKPAKGR